MTIDTDRRIQLEVCPTIWQSIRLEIAFKVETTIAVKDQRRKIIS